MKANNTCEKLVSNDMLFEKSNKVLIMLCLANLTISSVFNKCTWSNSRGFYLKYMKFVCILSTIFRRSYSKVHSLLLIRLWMCLLLWKFEILWLLPVCLIIIPHFNFFRLTNLSLNIRRFLKIPVFFWLKCLLKQIFKLIKSVKLLYNLILKNASIQLYSYW